MQGCSQKINIPEVRQALKENHNIEIPASTIFIEENTIPLQMRYCFSTQRFQTLIKNKVEIKFAKNSTNGNSRKAGCWHTVLLWLIKNRITGEKLDLSGALLKCRIYCRFELTKKVTI
jgi:hypothetical protein